MKLSTWAKKNNIQYKTAWKWFKKGKLPVPTTQFSNGTIIVNLPDDPLSIKKKCAKCKKHKLRSSFFKDSSRKDGLYHSCKKCERLRKKPYNKEYTKRRTKNDIVFKLKRTIRSRINNAIKQNHKAGSAVSDLGCSIEYFKSYIENKFLPGMTWDNYGKWHLDHIIPLSTFDLTNKNDFVKACHYTNYQPLWARDNILKGKR